MYVSVFLLLDESGMAGEVVFGPVFQYEQSVGGQEAGAEDLVGQGVESLDGVGRVGEHQVEGLGANVQEVEDVVPHDLHAAYAQRGGRLADEGGVGGVHLHRHDVAAAPGGHLEADAASAGEEVKEYRLFKVYHPHKDVEQPLFGKVGGGPCLVTCGGIDGLAPERT